MKPHFREHGMGLISRSDFFFELSGLKGFEGGLHRPRGAKEDPDPCLFQRCRCLSTDMPCDNTIDVFSGYEIPGSRPAGDSMHASSVFLRRMEACIEIVDDIVPATPEAGVHQVLKIGSGR